MRTVNFVELLQRAAAGGGPIAEAVKTALVNEGRGINLPKAMEAIKAAGVEIEYTPGSHGMWVRGFIAQKDSSDQPVLDNEGQPARDMVMQGYSNTEEDSALHAILGALREGR